MNNTNSTNNVSGTRNSLLTTKIGALTCLISCILYSNDLLADCDIPTGASPSPLFGAEPFTQALYRLEEFGTIPLPNSSNPGNPFPTPSDKNSSPAGYKLDNFMGQTLYPIPDSSHSGSYANTSDLNPWKAKINSFLGLNLVNPPAEGRPPGIDWAHQRWSEFYPEEYTVTAQSGVRENRGFRDQYQSMNFNLMNLKMAVYITPPSIGINNRALVITSRVRLMAFPLNFIPKCLSSKPIPCGRLMALSHQSC